MSYSNFGYIPIDEELRGPPGFGFATDGLGNYDIQNNSFVRVNDINLQSISSDGPILVNDPIQVSYVTMDDLLTDTIGAKTANVIHTSDTIFNSPVKITDVPGQDTITAPQYLHLQSNSRTGIFIQADRDNIGLTDNPFIYCSQDGGNRGFGLQLYGTGEFAMTTGNNIGAGGGVFTFNTAQIAPQGDNRFSFANSLELMRINNSRIDMFRTLDMNGNDITDTNQISVDNINSVGTSISVNNNMICNSGLDARGATYLRGNISNPDGVITFVDNLSMVNNNITSVGDLQVGGNLNNGTGNLTITSNVNFSNNDLLNCGDIRINGIVKNIGAPNILIGDNIDMQGNEILNTNIISDTNITLDPGDDNFVSVGLGSNLSIQNGFISMNQSTLTPSEPGGFQGLLYKSANELFWKVAGRTTNLSDVYAKQRSRVSSLTESTTTSGTYINKVSLAAGEISGLYKIKWYAEVTNTNIASRTSLRIQRNGTTTLAESYAPANVVAGDYIMMSGYVIESFTGAAIYNLDYFASGGTAKIRNAYLEVKSWG